MPLPRTLADRYRLLQPIGAGGMSVVWQARDDVLERPVAVKLLNDSVDPFLRTRLRLEAKAAAALNHPGIAQVYDYGEAEGDEPFLVMELVDGLALDRALTRDGTVAWQRAAAIGANLADALNAVHDHSLVHRDVKPANVILTARGPKLVDFGICASAGEVDDTNNILGTAAYLAPERIAGAPAGPAADVYAVGVLLYRTMVGALPWSADSTTALIKCHVFAEPTPPPPSRSLEPTLAATVMRCLSKDPAQRPTAAELAAALHRAAGPDAEPYPAEPLLASDRQSLPVHAARLPVQATSSSPPPDGPEPTAPAAIDDLDRTSEATAPLRASLPPDMAMRSPSGRPQRHRAVAAATSAIVAMGTLGMVWTDQGSPTHPPRPAIASRLGLAACAATFAVDRDWGDGFNATIAVHNRTLTLNAWDIAFDFPNGTQTVASRNANVRIAAAATTAAEVNATTRQAGSRVTVAATHLLRPGASVTVRLSGAYSRKNPLPTSVLLSGQSCATQVVGPSAPPVPTPAQTAKPESPTAGETYHPNSTGDRPSKDRKANNGKHRGKGHGADHKHR
jgi:eukaryotic-like serine/threonine-protein kinase